MNAKINTSGHQSTRNFLKWFESVTSPVPKSINAYAVQKIDLVKRAWTQQKKYYTNE